MHNSRWTRLLAPRRAALFASPVVGKRQNSTQAPKATQWKNQDGDVAPASAAQDEIITTGCA